MYSERITSLFSWELNPFTFQILPDLFVGYERETNSLMNGLQSGSKFSLILGPTGSGKTTLMKSMVNRLGGQFDHLMYLPKPPRNHEDWLEVFNDFTKQGFLRSMLSSGNGVNIYNLSQVLNEKLSEKKVLLFIDECQESSSESMEWLRALTDHIDNLYIVMAALPVFEGTLKSKLESLLRRVGTKVELTTLTKSETRELIKKRITRIGGDDIKPFTGGTIDYIFQRTGGFPREVLRLCSELVQEAVDKNISTIDTDFINETRQPEQRLSIEALDMLPERQRLILDTLSKGGQMTPSGIIDALDLEEYKNRDNAVRSVNNLLRRLMKEGLAERKKVGKTYRYAVSSKFQTLMVEA
ncbi:MAG: AAA family ATPase [Candidatus Aenigmarchaeota archaeon]|nr:AAA family ATPase [Candidatus Aenigmarchaeota archaeon]